MSTESFVNPQLYRILTYGVTQDLPHYQELVSKYGGPVLDLGAGLGRISDALLKEPVAMVLLEHSPAMCDELLHWIEHQSPAQQENLWLLQGDMTNPNVFKTEGYIHGKTETVPTRFGCIILGLRTLHLLSEKERYDVFMLAAQHLHTDGVLIIHHSNLSEVPVQPTWTLTIEHATQDGMLEVDECFFYHTSSGQYHLRHRIHQSNTTGQHIASWRVAHNLHPIDIIDVQQQLAEAGFASAERRQLYGTESLIVAKV